MFRLDPRLRIRLPIEVTPRWDGGEPIPLETIDLSTTGAACQSPVHLPLRTQVGVRLSLPGMAAGPAGGPASLRFEAVVVNIERIGRSRTEWRAGLYFLDLHGEDQEALRRYIYEGLKSEEEESMGMRGRAGSIGSAVALALAAALAWSSNGLAYTVITRDGHRIETRTRPEIRGESAFMRLAPGGQLAVIPQEQVDWAATEKVNPAPGVIAIPADAKLAGSESQASPVRIMRGPSRREAGATAVREGAPDEQSRTAGVPPPPLSKEQANEAVVKLQKEYAFLLRQREQLEAQHREHAAELAQLESTDPAHAGVENATTRRILALKEQIADEAGQIQRMSVRMNDIRVEAVGLGGAID